MAVSQLPQAPYRQDRKIFPTPIIGDVLFSEVRDCNRGNPFPEYGSPYPNANKWPDHKLVYVKPVDIERNEIFEFFYAAERKNQDLYNFALGNKIIANREFRMVTRTYVTLRENFKPEDMEFGTPMPDIPEGKFDGVSYVFFDKEQQNTQQEELNSLFVVEVHTYLEAAVLDEKLTLSVEKQDPLPPKFRVLAPTTTVDELAEGEVSAPTLTGDQLAVTEDQINTDLKRKRTVSRSSAENIGSLSGKQVTNVLQVADVVETIVPDGTTIETSELTVDGSVESLGNGQSLQRVITAPSLFSAESFSAERPDPTPPKFRILVPSESTEESVAGTAVMPTLTTGDLEASEQQVNVHVKRKRKTRRDTTSLPQTLVQKSTTNEKQIATVTEIFQVGDTAEGASATKDIQSEALGDGTYVVRKIEVPELFAAESYSVQKPEIIPEKFRSQVPTTTEQSSKTGQATPPSLAVGELERSRQQVNEFVYREQVTKRDLTNDVSMPEVQQAYVEGTVGKINEKLSSSPVIEKGLLVSESRATPIGDGKFIVQTVKVDKWPTLEGYEWDPVLNASVKRTQQFVSPSGAGAGINTTVQPVNEDRSLKVTEEVPTQALSSYVLSFPVQIDVQLPNVLKSISVVWSDQYGEGKFSSDWEGWANGTSASLSGSESGSATSSVALKPELVIDIEQPWGSDVSATSYYFFMQQGQTLEGRLNSLISGSVKKWPMFKPVSHTIILEGAGGSVRANVSAAASSSWSENSSMRDRTTGTGYDFDISTTFTAVSIPPTIHGAIQLDGGTEKDRTVTAVASVGWFGYNFPSVFANSIARKTISASVTPEALPATSPASIPTSGLYIVKSSVEPYRWGWLKCTAVVLDATNLS